MPRASSKTATRKPANLQKKAVKAMSFSEYRAAVEDGHGSKSAAEKYIDEVRASRQISDKDLSVVINAIG